MSVEECVNPEVILKCRISEAEIQTPGFRKCRVHYLQTTSAHDYQI